MVRSRRWLLLGGAALTVAILTPAACAGARSLQGGPPPAEPVPRTPAAGLDSWPATTASPEGPAPPPDNADSALGTNLAELEDYSPEWAFIDVFKQSRSWISGSTKDWDDGRPIDVDHHGWVRSLAPGQIARTLIFWNASLDYPTGDYLVLYDGRGDLDFSQTGEVVFEKPGRIVLRVGEARHGLALFVTRVNPEDPLRNIRVLAPGGSCDGDPFAACRIDTDCENRRCIPFEESYEEQIFHPHFLASLRGYGVLRFVHWMRTNGSTSSRWDDRPRLEDARWTPKGVPVEVMMNLAHRLRADPWFTLPHLADDDYVRRFAAAVHERLRDRKIYVEYSNEVWNGMFRQAQDAQQRGVEAGLGRGFEAQLRYYSRRSRQIFDIWRSVFGGTESLVRVMASQAGNPWVSEQVLGFESARDSTDVLAIAPYFGGELGNDHPVEGWSLDELMDHLAGPALDRAERAVQAHLEVAGKHGVQLVAYEGGQHLAASQPGADANRRNALFDSANRDPRMKAIYLDYLRRWRAAGGRIFMHFYSCGHYSQWGRWGAREFLTQPAAAAPKYAALMEFIRDNPRWW